MCLAIEMPFSIIQKMMFASRSSNHSEKTIYETTEAEAIKLSKKIAECEGEKPMKAFS